MQSNYSPPSPLPIGIIIPTYQEQDTLPICLKHLQIQSHPFEVVVADGGSTDLTITQATALQTSLGYPLATGRSPYRGRAAQMNWGAAQTHAEVLLFLHADSVLPPQGLDQIRLALEDATVVGGRFRVQLDSCQWPYPFITWGINTRSRLTGAFTGDMGIFLRRAAFETLGGYSLQPLMEDLDLADRMGQLGRKVFLPGRMLTSCRRWQKQGPWRTVALMQLLRAGYRLGISPQILARWYDTVR
jgi:rSAM/selenodomain-associated transferase 2